MPCDVPRRRPTTSCSLRSGRARTARILEGDCGVPLIAESRPFRDGNRKKDSRSIAFRMRKRDRSSRSSRSSIPGASVGFKPEWQARFGRCRRPIRSIRSPGLRPDWRPRLATAVTLGVVVALIGVMSWSGFGRPQAHVAPERPSLSMVPRPLANDSTPEHGPSLSPDGTQVVYDWQVNGVTGLYIKSIDSGPPRTLPVGEGIRLQGSAYAKWSPRGDRIAFLASQGPQQYGLYVVPPTGGTSRFLTSMAGIGLCWHPDGSSIGLIDRTGRDEPFSVFSLSIDTGERRRLTVPPAGGSGTRTARSLQMAVSSPSSGTDARRVRCLCLGCCNTVADAASDCGWSSNGWPRWTPDGQSIVFASAGLGRLPRMAAGLPRRR